MRSEQVQPTAYMTKQEQNTQIIHIVKNDTYPSFIFL